eukprot:10279943-Alexandrium_andersonii.AAC.1
MWRGDATSERCRSVFFRGAGSALRCRQVESRCSRLRLRKDATFAASQRALRSDASSREEAPITLPPRPLRHGHCARCMCVVCSAHALCTLCALRVLFASCTLRALCAVRVAPCALCVCVRGTRQRNRASRGFLSQAKVCGAREFAPSELQPRTFLRSFRNHCSYHAPRQHVACGCSPIAFCVWQVYTFAA